MGVKDERFVGKTIAAVTFSAHDPYVAFQFTDGTHAILKAELGYEDSVDVNFVDPTKVADYILRDLDVITAEEYARLTDEKRRQDMHSREQAERMLLRSLLQKYQP